MIINIPANFYFKIYVEIVQCLLTLVPYHTIKVAANKNQHYSHGTVAYAELDLNNNTKKPQYNRRKLSFYGIKETKFKSVYECMLQMVFKCTVLENFNDIDHYNTT